MVLFELHVLVDPSRATSLPEGPPGWRRAITVTTTGAYPVQPMYTAHINCDTVLGAMGRVAELEPFLTERGLRHTRVKIERLFTAATDAPDVEGVEYLEAHVKVGGVAPERFDRFASDCLEFGVQLLINPLSDTPLPVTTLRMYNTTFRDFIQKHTRVLEVLRRHGTVVRVHLEHGVLDTNPMTDAGWLFAHGQEFQTPITTVDCPERLESPETHLRRYGLRSQFDADFGRAA